MTDNRRRDVNRMIPAETAIRQAILEVEKLPANEMLTTAVTALIDAQGLVADWAEATGNVLPEQTKNCPCCGYPNCGHTHPVAADSNKKKEFGVPSLL